MPNNTKNQGEPPDFVKWLIWLKQDDIWKKRPLIAVIAALIMLSVVISAACSLLRMVPQRLYYRAPPPLVLKSIGASSLGRKNEGCITFALPALDHSASVNLPLNILNTAAKRLTNISVSLVLNSPYVHVLPEENATKTHFLGFLRSSNRERTTERSGDFSAATTFISGMNSNTEIMLGEPLVWTQQYLSLVKTGTAPIIDLSVQISADDVPKSLFKLRLQAVQELPTKEGLLTYSPEPFAGIHTALIMVASEMGMGEYDGAPCYVANGLTTKTVLLEK